ncbi:MAG: DUF4870 domain-containing protein [Anaerolineae bacterium]
MEHDPYQDPEAEEVVDAEITTEEDSGETTTASDTDKLPLIETDFEEADVTSNERTMAALAHGSILLTLLTGGFAGWIVALVIWAVYRRESQWVANQSLQALVFQVVATLGTYILLSIAGAAIALSTTLMVILVGFCILPFALIFGLVAICAPLAATAYGLFGALETYQGRDFRYRWVGNLVEERAQQLIG